MSLVKGAKINHGRITTEEGIQAKKLVSRPAKAEFWQKWLWACGDIHKGALEMPLCPTVMFAHMYVWQRHSFISKLSLMGSRLVREHPWEEELRAGWRMSLELEPAVKTAISQGAVAVQCCLPCPAQHSPSRTPSAHSMEWSECGLLFGERHQIYSAYKGIEIDFAFNLIFSCVCFWTPGHCEEDTVLSVCPVCPLVCVWGFGKGDVHRQSHSPGGTHCVVFLLPS